MAASASRRMTAVALSGWLAFAVVWVQQQSAAPPATAFAPTVLVRGEAGGAAAGINSVARAGGYVLERPATKGVLSGLGMDAIIEIPLGDTPKLRGNSFLPPNANPTAGTRSFAKNFPKSWAPPGTMRQRNPHQATTTYLTADGNVA